MEVPRPSLDPLSVGAVEWLPLLEWGARFAERYKHVTFPVEVAALWPSLRVEDERVHAELIIPPRPEVGRDGIASLMDDLAKRFDAPIVPRVLALDYRATRVTEVVLENWLYGEATLYDYPDRAPETHHLSVMKARARGWGSLLSETNLTPHNRMVIGPGDHGLFVESPAAASLAGVVAWLPNDKVAFEANPFVEVPANNPDFALWFAWGRARAEALGCG